MAAKKGEKAMQRLAKEHLFKNYPSRDDEGNLQPPLLPDEPPLHVEQGESFLIETVDTGHMLLMSEDQRDKPTGPMAGNPSTGPVYVEGIRAGDVIAVSIESLEVVGHTIIGTGQHSLLPSALVKERKDFVKIESGIANFPGGLKIPVRPMYGCFGVVPVDVQPEPYMHGGNMDIPDICAGNTIHLRCERDGGYFACGDGHALQGDGEINGFALEVSLLGQLRIDKSPYQALKTILIETPEKLITVGIKHEARDAVTDAVHAMSELLAQAREIDLLEAYQFVSHIGDVRVGAMWPMWSEWHIAVPMCLHLDRVYFD
ncbi:acetamidase/formamidase family protein [Chloroflexi bacterium TSY]|nr:acetamidase/formamidase family protein [Chloroflexi bacterium TSY]